MSLAVGDSHQHGESCAGHGHEVALRVLLMPAVHHSTAIRAPCSQPTAL